MELSVVTGVILTVAKYNELMELIHLCEKAVEYPDYPDVVVLARVALKQWKDQA